MCLVAYLSAHSLYRNEPDLHAFWSMSYAALMLLLLPQLCCRKRVPRRWAGVIRL